MLGWVCCCAIAQTPLKQGGSAGFAASQSVTAQSDAATTLASLRRSIDAGHAADALRRIAELRTRGADTGGPLVEGQRQTRLDMGTFQGWIGSRGWRTIRFHS